MAPKWFDHWTTWAGQFPTCVETKVWKVRLAVNKKDWGVTTNPTIYGIRSQNQDNRVRNRSRYGMLIM